MKDIKGTSMYGGKYFQYQFVVAGCFLSEWQLKGPHMTSDMCCVIKLNDEYEPEQYLTLTCIGSPAGVITPFESSIIFKAMSATWTA